MADRIPGAGTTLSVKISASYVPIPQIVNLTPPQSKRNRIERTNLDSLAYERGVTIPDNDACSGTLQLDFADSTHQYLIDSFEAGDREDWKVTYSDSTEDQFFGFIEAFPVAQIEVTGDVTIPISIAVDGAVTRT